MSKKVFITFEEAVDEYDLDPLLLRKWMAEGELRGYRFHNTFSFKRDELDKVSGIQLNAPGVDLDELFKPGTKGDAEDDEETVDQIMREAFTDQPQEGEDEATSFESVGEDHIPVPPPIHGLEILAYDDEEALPPPDNYSQDDEGTPPHKDEEQPTPMTNSVPLTPEEPLGHSSGDDDGQNFIRFSCKCGKRLKTKQEYIGQLVPCSRCGKEVKVPPESEVRPPVEQKSKTVNIIERFKRRQNQIDEKIKSLEAILEESRSHAAQRAEGVSTGENLDSNAVKPLKERIEEFDEKLESFVSRMEEIQKQNEQTKFDIARLYDLASRDRPAGYHTDVHEKDSEGDEDSET